MALPPIFKFKNIRVRLDSVLPTLIYGVVSNDGSPNTLDPGIRPRDVSAVILTVQISNLTTATVPISAYVYNSATLNPDLLTFNNDALTLVKNYPLLAKNAFDPLSGNLVLAENDQLWLQANTANACDVVVSLLEIANATAS
jgi:hypothetical protein